MNSHISAQSNALLLEEKYQQWRQDPSLVDEKWNIFFEGFQLGLEKSEEEEGASASIPESREARDAFFEKKMETEFGAPKEILAIPGFLTRLVNMVYAYRTLGHTAAWIDPLSKKPPHQPKLDREEFGFTEEDLDRTVGTRFLLQGRQMPLREMEKKLQSIYCDRIGFEYMHIHNTDVRKWLQNKIDNRLEEQSHSTETKLNVMQWLLEAESYENYLHKRFIGEKRFGIQGGESTLVALHAILENCPQHNVKHIVMGMAHRGRLNVLANFLQKPLEILLYEFSPNYVPQSNMGGGDVKYHLGYEKNRTLKDGSEVNIHLAANPSHLEAVNPVVEGKARAIQRKIGDTEERNQVLPLLIHGDAAFSGQGLVAEVLNLSQLPGYRTGGTIHLIINNQIGFTTMPADARSSAYATDVAKMIEAPIFHVNGDDPLEVLFCAQLAFEFRQTFGRDVVIDLYCYRRLGHNEGDEPGFTLPHIYTKIKNHPSAATLFKEKLVSEGEITADKIDALEKACYDRLEKEDEALKEKESSATYSPYQEATTEFQPSYSFDPIPTGIPEETLRHIGNKLLETPENFKIHPTLEKRFVARRKKAIETGFNIDWAHAEALAFGSLLTEGAPIRLSGQDSRRGTFSQRHAVFYDAETRERHTPLNNLSEDQAHFCCYNSLLSEAAVLGFDYGYSLAEPEMLILWEAQFGDFANGAQVIIDQFITSAESKWAQPSRITMLLPHAYEGMGPEHSSARIERFLQLCAHNNIQVCNLTSPSQYFHLLRRQSRRPLRKPLILFTPKTLLGSPVCVSSIKEFIGFSSFREVLDDTLLPDEKEKITRLIFCSGHVYYDLLEFRKERKFEHAAIIRVEQLYPLHTQLLMEIAASYPNAQKWTWCQEEPKNMGAWSFIRPLLQKCTGHKVRYAGRDHASSPATGSKLVHKREQKKLLETAFEG